MKKITASLITALAVSSAYANSPLSFDYMVTGSDLLRPVLVFNDGENTYIQPPDTVHPSAITVSAAEAQRYGPYIMVKGLPKAFAMGVKKEQVNIVYVGPKVVERQQDRSFESRQRAVSSANPVIVAATATTATEVRNAALASIAAIASDPVTQSTTKSVTKPASECAGRVTKTESAFLVGLDSNSPKLSASAIGKLRAAIEPTQDIETIYASLPIGNERVSGGGHARALVDAMTSIGIPAAKIHTDHKGKVSLGAEVRIVRAKITPCAPEGILIEAPHRGAVTVIANADVKVIVGLLAEKLGVPFRIEGEPVAIPLVISESEVPLVTVLQKIGIGVSQRATIISRQHELVIRYRTN